MKLFALFVCLLSADAYAASAVESDELFDLLSPDQISQELLNSDDGTPAVAPTAEGGPRVVVIVDKSEQHLWVYEDGELTNDWPVSTGTERKKCPPNGACYVAHTPTGTFIPFRMHYTHTSSLWNARMDRAIFISGGIALHATYGDHIRQLGTRQSGGCVRQSPFNADKLYQIVSYYGANNTRVTIRE